jgi:hypothetical protein
MEKFKNMFVIIIIAVSAIIFTSCQNEQNPIESQGFQNSTQPGLSKFSIPAGATFVSAKFYIYVIIPSSQDINLHRVTSPWEELVVTWNNFGGAYAPAIEGTFNAAAAGWYSVDVTSLVGSWLDGTNANYGLLLDQVEKITPRTRYGAREWTYKPYLEICYTENDGPLVCDTTRSIEDAYIWQVTPDANYGDELVLYTGWQYATDLEKQSLVKFDIEYTPPPVVECETAYAFGGSVATCFLDLSPINANNWGWTNYIGEGSYDWPIYAGAGQCNISNGTSVGNLSVEYSSGTVTITYELDPGFNLDETHVWVGSTPLPVKRGQYTTAPGQFNHNFENPVIVSGLSGNIYIAAHAVVCWEVE